MQIARFSFFIPFPYFFRMKKFTAALLISVVLIAAFPRCSGSADTFKNRKELARELLESDCKGLGRLVVEYVKEQADIKGDNLASKAGEVAMRYLINRECECLAETISDKLASEYTLAELEALEGKPLSEITKLPQAMLKAHSGILDCVKFAL